MSRWGPSVLPTAASPWTSAIGAVGDTIAQSTEERRRRRQQDLAEAMGLAQMQEQGIERDPLAGRRNRDARAERMQAERIPGVDAYQMPGMSVDLARVQEPSQDPAPRGAQFHSLQGAGDIAPRAMAATPSAAGRYRDLGDTGFRLDTQGTPMARAESMRRMRRDELAAALPETMGYEEAIPAAIQERRADKNRRMALDFARAVTPREGHAGHATFYAGTGDEAGMRGELDPAVERESPEQRHAREMELENLRGRNDLRVAGVRAATTLGKPMSLRDADYIISGYLATPTGKQWTAGQRLDFTRQLVAGTLTQGDLDRMTAAPAAAPEDNSPGFFTRLGRAVVPGGRGWSDSAPRGTPLPASDTTTVNLNRPATPPKTTISRAEYDAVVADKGRAYAARHFVKGR